MHACVRGYMHVCVYACARTASASTRISSRLFELWTDLARQAAVVLLKPLLQQPVSFVNPASD